MFSPNKQGGQSQAIIPLISASQSPLLPSLVVGRDGLSLLTQAAVCGNMEIELCHYNN